MEHHGFTPFALDTLVESTGKHAFTVREPNKVLVVVMGGRDVHNKRIRREVRTSFTQAWLDYQGRWGLTHLWVIDHGRRRLVHRK